MCDPLQGHLHTEDVAEGQHCSLKGPVVVLRGECRVCDLLSEHLHTEDVAEGQHYEYGLLSLARKVLQPANAPELSMGRLHTEGVAGVLHLEHGPLFSALRALQHAGAQHQPCMCLLRR